MVEEANQPSILSPSSFVVDADVHTVITSVGVLFPYLTDFWKEYITQSDFKGPRENPYPKNAPTTIRPDARRTDGIAPGANLAVVREQSLAGALWAGGRIHYAILNNTYALESVHNPDAAAALASAVNDWHIAEWLEKDDRLRASILVPSQQPEMAAREIDRVGDHPGFVQVLLPVHGLEPYGNRRFHPLYEAAVRHDLAIGLHYGGAPGSPPSAAGWPSTYMEEQVGMAQIFQSQLISLIVEGIFDRFPMLRVAVIEGGFTWLPSLMWRFDKEWKGLRREVPWVRRPPSDYIREHVRFTTQPLDAPPTSEQFLQVLDQIGADDLLMFSTDYPHWHFDTPEEAFPFDIVPEATARKIMSENARAFYRLT
ncbi:MAG: amidohydrolase [Thermomicrobia bacterium]|nr:amidohydrolase [Thermomicrobia bacterium]